MYYPDRIHYVPAPGCRRAVFDCSNTEVVKIQKSLGPFCECVSVYKSGEMTMEDVGGTSLPVALGAHPSSTEPFRALISPLAPSLQLKHAEGYDEHPAGTSFFISGSLHSHCPSPRTMWIFASASSIVACPRLGPSHPRSAHY